MITTTQLECTKNIISDFKYAKEFKTPLVLFTKEHEVIGLGEFMSYIKIETNKQLQSFLSNILVETKNFAKLFKNISKPDLDSRIFYNGRNPMTLCTTKDVQIGLGIGTEQLTSSVYRVLTEINSNFEVVWDEDITKGEYLTQLRKLKTEEGSLNFIIHSNTAGDWIIPMTKKMLPVVLTDKVYVELLQHKSNHSCLYSYIRFITRTKDGLIFETYFKILRV